MQDERVLVTGGTGFIGSNLLNHLAALSSYAIHEENLQSGPRVNVEGFVNIVEQTRQDSTLTSGIQRIWKKQRRDWRGGGVNEGETVEAAAGD